MESYSYTIYAYILLVGAGSVSCQLLFLYQPILFQKKKYLSFITPFFLVLFVIGLLPRDIFQFDHVGIFRLLKMPMITFLIISPMIWIYLKLTGHELRSTFLSMDMTRMNEGLFNFTLCTCSGVIAFVLTMYIDSLLI